VPAGLLLPPPFPEGEPESCRRGEDEQRGRFWDYLNEGLEMQIIGPELKPGRSVDTRKRLPTGIEVADRPDPYALGLPGAWRRRTDIVRRNRVLCAGDLLDLLGKGDEQRERGATRR